MKQDFHNEMIVLTPHFRATLSPLEKRRLQISLSNTLGQHAFVLPESLKPEFLSSFPNSKTFFFKDNFFESRAAYSRLLLDIEFYLKFQEYEFMMILQTDAIIVKPLPKRVYSEFDYIGAPWGKPKKILLTKSYLSIDSRRQPWRKRICISIGNGGLSIRRISSMQECVDLIKKKYPFLANGDYNEDTVLASILKLYNFSLPTAEYAGMVFCEQLSVNLDEVKDLYGFHALNRFNPELENKILDTA